MTWLGKILTFMVFLGALAWGYFTLQAFVLRTNWKVEADKYKKAYNEAKAKRQDEANRFYAAEEALRRRVAIAQQQNDALNSQVRDLVAAAKKTTDDITRLQSEYEKGDVTSLKLQANLDSSVKELKFVRDRNYSLEDGRVQLVIAAEDARREMVRARNSEKLAQSIADDNAKKVEDLVARVTELRQGGGSGSAVVRSIDKPAPPVLPNLRGEVTDLAGDLLVISVGIDSGLAVGTTLDLYRLAGGGTYLGTVKVTSSSNLYPKQAVVRFTPARNVPLDRLSADELPRKGDLVKPTDGAGR